MPKPGEVREGKQAIGVKPGRRFVNVSPVAEYNAAGHDWSNSSVCDRDTRQGNTPEDSRRVAKCHVALRSEFNLHVTNLGMCEGVR